MFAVSSLYSIPRSMKCCRTNYYRFMSLVYFLVYMQQAVSSEKRIYGGKGVLTRQNAERQSIIQRHPVIVVFNRYTTITC